MAKVYSEKPPEQIDNRGERQVFLALRQCLPNSFLVFHSLPFLREHAKGHNLVDGQIDFVILDQERGVLLVLEVKQGTITRCVENDRLVWRQNDIKMDVSPWEQAAGNKYSLIDWMSSQLGVVSKRFPLSHGHAVLLPDVYGDLPALPEAPQDVAITWKSDQALADRIVECCKAWHQCGRREPKDDELDAVRKLLIPEVQYGGHLSDRIGIERLGAQEIQNNLDQLIEFIGNRRQAHIAGCAGAGKTTLAIIKARQLAADGQTVLFLTYNEAIAGYLAQHLSEHKVTVRTFHDFCRECCECAGIEWPRWTVGSRSWWERAPVLLDEALSKAPQVFDALLVDEAQDFQFSAWLSLERAIKPDGWYYIFYDKKQNLYGGDLQWPGSATELPFLLLRNCRSTVSIVEAVRRHTGISMGASPALPPGSPVLEVEAPTPAQRRSLLGKLLHDWVRKEGLSENQIVILGGHRRDHTCLRGFEKAGSFRIVERAKPASGVIPYYTYMAFKGCESDAVILLDVDRNDVRWDTQGLYSAMTRARHLLGMVWVEVRPA